MLNVPLNGPHLVVFLRSLHEIIFTVPLSASTSTRSPFFNTLVAIWVHTTQGILSSREIIAAWQVMPPSSVTIAAAWRISGTMLVVVMLVTTILPDGIEIFETSTSPDGTKHTRPRALPGDTTKPKIS